MRQWSWSFSSLRACMRTALPSRYSFEQVVYILQQQQMFEAGFALSSFSEISLANFPSILQQHKHAQAQKHIDTLISQCNTPLPKYFQLQLQFIQQLNRPQFYAILKKSLTKYLKVQSFLFEKFAKTIKELVQSRQQSGGMGWLKEMMQRLQGLITNSYKYIRLIQLSMEWPNCHQAICQQRQSEQSFRKDIFAYLISTSETLKATLKQVVEKSSIKHSFSPYIKENLNEIKLQLEEECQQSHAKPKKKKKKKGKTTQVQGIEKETIIQEDQKLLTAFLEELSIEEEQRERCTVTEEWINSIRPSSFFKK